MKNGKYNKLIFKDAIGVLFILYSLAIIYFFFFFFFGALYLYKYDPTSFGYFKKTFKHFIFYQFCFYYYNPSEIIHIYSFLSIVGGCGFKMYYLHLLTYNIFIYFSIFYFFFTLYIIYKILYKSK